MQAKRNDQASITLTPEQEEEVKHFTAERARARKELRETQRSLNVDIDRLDNEIKVVNIVVAPLIVAAVGVVVLAMRRRRRARGSSQTRLSPSESRAT